jgi:hypothetical protein
MIVMPGYVDVSHRHLNEEDFIRRAGRQRGISNRLQRPFG